MNKRGMLLETVIFIILNILFFALLATFIVTSASGATLYEQAYAKEIALMIDQAKPNTTISLDIGEALEIAKKNEVKLGEIFHIDNLEKRVVIRFGPKGSYSFQYFSDYEILPDANSGQFISGNYIVLRIMERSA